MTHSFRDRLYRTNAIVLQIRDLGEADRILVVFTLGHGKISIIAKGARKARSRMGPYLDYFSEVALHLTRGRDLDVVTSVATIHQHPNLRTDIDAFGYAAHFAELVRDLTQERQENPRVYEMLSSSLSLLNDGIDPWHIARHFELGLLITLGYSPQLLRCVSCQRDLDAVPNRFSSGLGGMLCDRCAGLDPSAMLLSINAQKYVRMLSRSGLSSVIGIQPSAFERHEVGQAMSSYLRHVGERDFNSLRVLGAMQQSSNAHIERESALD